MKNKIITFLFIGYICIFSVLGLAFKDEKISSTERRKLATFPNFEFTSNYITKIDKYFLDHFPFRDTFRSIKANYNYKILNKFDNNGIYLKDNYIFKSNYPTNNNSISNFKKHVLSMKSLFSNSNVYIMVVPDKNYYLNDDKFLKIDYDYLYGEISKLGEFIDLRDSLEIRDYYQTDTHWRQERLDKVVKKMSGQMGFSYKKISYTENKYDSFYGVYYGESALKREPEELIYLTSDEYSGVSVKYLENDKLTDIYNVSKLTSFDSYEVFLDGASSFIEINNSNVLDKELVVFRDSFGSSLIPLLIPYYSKITVVDNRYIASQYFKDLLDTDNKDILFLYSTLVINDSSSLKN